MRMRPNPLAIIAAAAAVPVLVKSAKPVAKKIGNGIKKLGEKLVESVEKMEEEESKVQINQQKILRHQKGRSQRRSPCT